MFRTKTVCKSLPGSKWVIATGAASLMFCFSATLCRAQQDDSPQLSLDGQMSLPRQWHGIMPKRSPNAVPYRVAGNGVKGAYSPISGCSGVTLSYYDGPVVSNVQIVPVFWSSAVNATLTAPTTGIAQFYADVTTTSAFGMLSEYNTNVNGGTGQSIGVGSAVAAVTLVPSVCATAAKCTVTDAQVQTELNAQIGAGHLPAIQHDELGNPNTLYMVHFPPNVTINASAIGAGTSCVQFCAYHNTGTSSGGEPLLYGILPDEFTSACNTGCGGNATDMENQTSTAFHELAEAVTDADVGLVPVTAPNAEYPMAWYNNSCGEIADICDTGAAGPTTTVSGRSWTLQPLWSNKSKACVSGDGFSASGYSPSVWIGNSNASLSTIAENNGYFLAKSSFTGGGLGTIAGPQAMAFDSSSNLWIANTGSTGVSKFDFNGNPVGSSPYTTGINNPGALAIDGSNTLWVANGNGTVVRLSNAGAVLTTDASSSFNGPAGMVIDISGNVWVTNATAGTVSEIVGAAAPAATLSEAVANNTVGTKP
jgi:hypothetical protein